MAIFHVATIHVCKYIESFRENQYISYKDYLGGCLGKASQDMCSNDEWTKQIILSLVIFHQNLTSEMSWEFPFVVDPHRTFLK